MRPVTLLMRFSIPSPVVGINRSLQFQIIVLTFRIRNSCSNSSISNSEDDLPCFQSSIQPLTGLKRGEVAMISHTIAWLASLITIHWKPNVHDLNRSPFQ